MGIYDDSVRIDSIDDYHRVKRDLAENKHILELQMDQYQKEGLTTDHIATLVFPIQYAIDLAEASIKSYMTTSSKG